MNNRVFRNYSLPEVKQESNRIFKLALPAIFSNLTVPLMGLVDMFFTGNYLDELNLAGISLGSVIFSAIFWSFGFLKMGTTGLSAIAYGGGKNTEVYDILRRSVIVSVVVGTLMILLSQVISDIAVALFDADDSAKIYAEIYLTQRIYSAPAVLCLFCFFGWFMGTGNPEYSLYILLISAGVNFILDYVFVVHFNLELVGIAWATVISQYTGLLVAIYILLKSKAGFFGGFFLKRLYREMEPWVSFFRLNLDIFIRTLLLTWGLSRFVSLSSSQGNDILTVNTILLQIWTFIAYFLDGYAHAAENLVGTSIGGKNSNKYSLQKNLLFFWSFFTAAVFSAGLYFWGVDIVRIISRFEVHAVTAEFYLIWLCLSPLLGNYCFIWDGIYIGSTDSAIMRNMMILSFCIYYALTLWLELYLNNHLLWFIFLSFTFMRGFSLHICSYRREKIWFG